MDLFQKLNEAIMSGNQREIERVKRQILLSGRDISIDIDFINSIKGKTLYKTMMKSLKDDNQMSFIDYEKMISSLITHCLIEVQVRNRDVNDYPIRELYVLLGKFINNDGKDTAIEDCKSFIQDRYMNLVSDSEE